MARRLRTHADSARLQFRTSSYNHRSPPLAHRTCTLSVEFVLISYEILLSHYRRNMWIKQAWVGRGTKKGSDGCGRSGSGEAGGEDPAPRRVTGSGHTGDVGHEHLVVLLSGEWFDLVRDGGGVVVVRRVRHGVGALRYQREVPRAADDHVRGWARDPVPAVAAARPSLAGTLSVAFGPALSRRPVALLLGGGVRHPDGVRHDGDHRGLRGRTR